MFLIFASLASVMAVIGRIRVVAQRESDESSLQFLRHFFFFLFLLFFVLESDEYVSDESDDEGSGSGFTSGSCSFSFFPEKILLVV